MRPEFGTTAAMAVALAVVFEGLLYALLAPRMPALARELAETPPPRIRTIGFAIAAAGLLALVWMRVRWFD